jgi:signal transduction histidine kinase
MAASRFRRRLRLVPLEGKLALVVVVFAAIVTTLVLFAVVEMHVLSAVRAYVGGEGLWSKGQKTAVYRLQRYATTRDAHDWQTFREAIAVPLGDRRARLALDRPDPDAATASSGFLQGRNHPDDVPALIGLFRRFRNVSYMARSVDIWAAADEQILKLEELGGRIHRAIVRDADALEMQRLLDELDAIDAAAGPLADDFSANLGEAARWVQRMVQRLLVLAGLLLVSVGVLVSWLVARHLRRGESALRDSRARLAAEARVSGALVRAGRELISTLDAPTQLDRLCALTAEVLPCDLSQAWLHETSDDAFVLRAGFGQTQEENEGTRVLRIASRALAPLLDRLRGNGVVAIDPPAHEALQLAPFARHAALRPGLYVALRRGNDVVGFQTAIRRDARHVFGPAELRIAEGIGQLASMALGNASLLEQIEEANRVKSEFVATMSHELRTPLHIIVGCTDLLLEGTFEPLRPGQADTVRRIDRAADELCELISATLDMSRLQAGRVRVDPEAVDVAEFLADLAPSIQVPRDRSAVALSWQAEDAIGVVRTDRLKLKVVVKNLVRNALKFTEHGSVRVSARRLRGGVEIAVRDTGLGIPAEKQSEIFDAFRQAAGGDGKSYGGVCLGLYIAQRLVALLGGTIGVDSEPGRGSTFRVWLPAALAGERRAA